MTHAEEEEDEVSLTVEAALSIVLVLVDGAPSCVLRIRSTVFSGTMIILRARFITPCVDIRRDGKFLRAEPR